MEVRNKLWEEFKQAKANVVCIRRHLRHRLGNNHLIKIDNKTNRPTDFQQKCRLSVGLLMTFPNGR